MKNRTDIVLSADERELLRSYSTTGKRSVRLVNRAKVILALDTSDGPIAETQERISANVGVSRQAIKNIKTDFFAANDVEEFLQRKKRKTPPVEPKITGNVEAHIIAMMCGEPPEGFTKWTLRLVAEKCVELNYVGALSHMSVQRILKKHNLSLT